MWASIIVPAYNAEGTIQACLRALKAQNSPQRFEVIVVDDGSNDRTAAIAESLQDVRVMRRQHMGAAAARNAGAAAAQGEILLFTDADCEPDESWVERMIAPFARDPDLVGVKGTYRTQQKQLVARWVQLEYEEKYERMRWARSIDFVDTYSAGYRRTAFLANGGFDEGYPSASVEDQEFSFRLAACGYRMAFVPEAIVRHRHVTTPWAYARRKLRIGYWKAKLHRRHPRKVWRDDHTPASLKMQLALMAVVFISLAAAPFWPWVWLLTAGSGAALAATMLPFLCLAATRDPAVAVIAPAMIVVRAGALGTGLVVGVWGELWRSGAVKRMFDLVGALLGLLFSLPLWPLIALAIRLESPGPTFFTQLRAGQGGKPFTIYKFRTMVNGSEEMLARVMERSCVPPPVYKILDDPRVTRVGRLLRRLSLDELPQFVNVLKGEMSLVGPRPEELWVVALYEEWHRQRLTVKPGMTGPMQVDGRGRLSLDDRVKLELEFIAKDNIWMDLQVALQTVPAMIRGEGAF